MKKTAIVTCSHNTDSKSTKLALVAKEQMKNASVFSLKDLELPFCDGDTVYALPKVIELTKELNAFDVFLFAVPIYNFSINAAAKNFIEIFGECLTEKPIGIIASAGGVRGYMATTSFMNSLALDFRCQVVPKFVFATPEDWAEDGAPTQEIRERITELVIVVQSDLS